MNKRENWDLLYQQLIKQDEYRSRPQFQPDNEEEGKVMTRINIERVADMLFNSDGSIKDHVNIFLQEQEKIKNSK